MKESAIEVRNLTRSMLVEGATRGMYDMPALVQVFLKSTASVGGKSTTM